MSTATRLATRTVHDGRVFRIDIDRVRLPHGREVDLEIVRHPESVVIVPIDEEGRVVLIRQYRYAVDHVMWELPAGSIDPGESLEGATRRECHEEIGLWPVSVERLGAFHPTPGYCDEVMVFFKATGLTRPAHEAHQDPDEDIEPHAVPLDEARAMIARGEITDMKTIVGIGLI
jgi:ADP-ribose pyrophosphatase